MSEMPEKIWAKVYGQRTVITLGKAAKTTTHPVGSWEARPHGAAAEYVRADLIAKLVEALEPFVPPHKDWMDDHPDDRPSALYMQTTFGQQRAARSALARAKGGTDDH